MKRLPQRLATGVYQIALGGVNVFLIDLDDGAGETAAGAAGGGTAPGGLVLVDTGFARSSARIGVDVNLHTGRWTFEEAVKYFMEAGGLDREAALEVAVHRNLDPAGDGLEVGQRVVEGHAVVGDPVRPGEAGARRGQGGKAEPGEQPGAAEVPRIGEHEAAGLVESAEELDPLG